VQKKERLEQKHSRRSKKELEKEKLQHRVEELMQESQRLSEEIQKVGVKKTGTFVSPKHPEANRVVKFRVREVPSAEPISVSVDQTLGLVRVIARAVEVWGTSEKALRWIHSPVRSLGNHPPISLLDRPEGIERVEEALGRIEQGVW